MAFIKLDPKKYAEGVARVKAEIDELDKLIAENPTDELKAKRARTAAYLTGLQSFPVDTE